MYPTLPIYIVPLNILTDSESPIKLLIGGLFRGAPNPPNPKEGSYSLSIYLSILGCSLDELPLLGLTNVVRKMEGTTVPSRSAFTINLKSTVENPSSRVD